MNEDEVRCLIRGYHREEIPDYQMAAFLMAAFLRGLSEEETSWLTKEMLTSGQRLDLSEMDSPVVGKHSTGGVGDKVSIVLAPLVASAGVVVPMIAGRGLGHTGGTIDKLESIPGFNASLDIITFRDILWEVGTAITAQGEEIAPVDRRLYSLRDATETVESRGLIVSSIMSKKLSEGLQGLVLDVKCGKGAFLKREDEARDMAETMVRIGNSFGVRTVAVITDMEEPLGKAVGNALEVRECINLLKGRGEPDLEEVVLFLGAWMLYIAEEVSESQELGAFRLAREGIDQERFYQKIARLKELLASGEAMKKFVEMVEAQGGRAEVVVSPGLLPIARNIHTIEATTEGYIQTVDAEKVGTATMLLGGGRMRMDDVIDHSVGVVLLKKSGQFVKQREPLAVIHYNDDERLKEAETLLKDSFRIGPESPPEKKMIRGVVV